jgi:hypothetical protein
VRLYLAGPLGSEASARGDSLAVSKRQRSLSTDLPLERRHDTSEKADEVSVAISRAFVAMRDRLTDLDALARAVPEMLERLDALEDDAASPAGDAAHRDAEARMLVDGVKTLKNIVKEMKRAERSLPPAM